MEIITTDDADELAQMLRKYSQAYYDGENSGVSDAEFDALVDKLRSLDPNHDFLKEVGATVISGVWPKRKHSTLMGSLAKAVSKEEFLHWAKDKSGLFLTEKADGSTVVASYKNGKLVAVTTRGDGTEGEDITPNAVNLKNVKKELPEQFTGEIRGEAMMLISTFKSVFEPLGYKNARNSATGKLRDQKSPELLKHLEVRWFDVIAPGNTELKTELDKFDFLKRMGLDTISHSTRLLTPEQVWENYENYVETKRESLDYEIDGLVVKVADLSTQEELGITSGRPKGALAIKFPSKREPTKLENVIWQRGKTGRYTPVAVLAPVSVAGVTIVNASLHNADQIAKLGIAIGDTVMVQRNNDVIPQVIKLVSKGEKRKDIKPPTECHVCKTLLVHDGAYLTCSNADCGGNVFGQLMTWIEEVKIMSLGPSFVQALVDHGITDAIKLYKASEIGLSTALGSYKLGQKAFDNIQATKSITLDLFLSALSIPSLGTTNGKRLAAHFKTLDAILAASQEEIGKIPGIKTNAVKIYKGLQEKKSYIKNLAKLLTITEPPPAIVGGKLEGKSFCITGPLSKPREEVETWIKGHGGIVKSSVSKGLSYLVTNEPNSGTTKSIKATSLGIPIVNESSLYALI